MNKRSTAPARALAAAAVIGGFLIVIVVVASSVGGGGSESSREKAPVGERTREHVEAKPKAASYVVQNGDTLTSIAHQTGVSVARLIALNPGVDPQILISGEKLKLR